MTSQEKKKKAYFLSRVFFARKLRSLCGKFVTILKQEKKKVKKIEARYETVEVCHSTKTEESFQEQEFVLPLLYG